MRIPTPSQASSTLSEEAKSTTTLSHNQYVYIRVRNLLQSIPTSGVNLPTTPPSGHLYLIKGKIQEIRRYAGATDWPFKTDDDTDDELEFEDYDGIEPPYPTYHFDRYLAEQGEKQMLLERAEAVALWASGVQ